MCLEDLKLMMETLGAPQTHLSLKKMIQEVDTDGDSKISFQEVSHSTFADRFIKLSLCMFPTKHFVKNVHNIFTSKAYVLPVKENWLTS